MFATGGTAVQQLVGVLAPHFVDLDVTQQKGIFQKRFSADFTRKQLLGRG